MTRAALTAFQRLEAESGLKGKLRFGGQEIEVSINDRLLEKKTIGGFPLKKFYPELGNAALWCCTELNSKEQIDAAVKAVGQ